MIKFLKNFLWKIFNKEKYSDLKRNESINQKIDNYNSDVLNKIELFRTKLESEKILNFVHSGHLGDLIYSLPIIQEISKKSQCNFYVNINKKMDKPYGNKPSGNVLLNKKTANMLLPLLRKQNYINEAEIYSNQKIDIDLDFFRETQISVNFHSIRWYSHLVGVPIDMNKKYLEVEESKLFKNKIVIVRSQRYRNIFINYKFLESLKDVVCIGLKDEFDDLKRDIKNLEFYDCKDFLEMAEIIKSSKFFIGNQTFAYSLAEGLKTKRLLENCPEFPLVFPNGENAFDFFHQIHFEKYFNKLNN